MHDNSDFHEEFPLTTIKCVIERLRLILIDLINSFYIQLLHIISAILIN